MLVKCDKCGQSYEVNDSRLSPQGAKIKCSKCGHIFLVRLDGSNKSAAASSTPSVTGAPASDLPKEEESWRVRHIGLTYTFHDMDSLREWLGARNTLNDVKIAKGEDDWKELGDYANVLTTELITKFFPLGDVPTTKDKEKSLENAGKDGDLPLGGSGLAPQVDMAPTSTLSDLSTPIDSKQKKNAKQIRKEKALEAEEKKKAKRNLIILAVVGVGLVVALIFGLNFQRSGTLPFDNTDEDTVAENVNPSIEEVAPAVKDVVKEAPAAADPAPQAAPEKADKPADKPAVLTDEEVQRAVEEEFQQTIKGARDLIKNKQWPEARATLESLREERPDNLQVLTLLQQTYRGLGLNSQASELDAVIKKLQADAKKKAAEDAKKAAEAVNFDDWSDVGE